MTILTSRGRVGRGEIDLLEPTEQDILDAIDRLDATECLWRSASFPILNDDSKSARRLAKRFCSGHERWRIYLDLRCDSWIAEVAG